MVIKSPFKYENSEIVQNISLDVHPTHSVS